MRRVGSAIALLILVVSVASACAVPTIPGSSVRTCHANADCPAGAICAFSVNKSCDQGGICVASDGTACVSQTACGCDGKTTTVCLSNGNSPSPVDFLGSCDGATQQGYDATLPPVADSSQPPQVDAADAFVPPVDASPITDVAEPIDSADSADTAPASTYGSPCNQNSDCTDPTYNQCGLNNTCTKACSHNSQCPVPPTLGTCNLLLGLCD
jgi:hypothetical protein